MEFFEGMRGAVHVTFEEGTQAQWLHELLAPRVDRVVVCDRRGQPRHGNKADQGDADQLSELLRRGGLRPVYHGDTHRTTLKELARTYQNLVEDSTRVMQRIKALYPARGIKTAGTSVYHPRHRAEWLAQLPEGGGSVPGRDTLRPARRAAGSAPEGQGCDGCRGPAGSSVDCIADHPVLWAGARGVDSGHDVDALAVPDEAKPVGLRRPGGRDPVQRGLCDGRGPACSAPAGTDDAWAEPKPQSCAQGCLQRCGNGRHGATGSTTGLLSWHGRPRNEGGAGTRDTRP